MILRWFSHFSTRTLTPMALTREQIASIAALARLDLTPSEIPVYQDSLSRILDFVGALERARHRQRRARWRIRFPDCRSGCGPMWSPRGTITSVPGECAAYRGGAVPRAQGHRVRRA